MDIQKKLSFSDMIGNLDAAKQNSDLQNLANALKATQRLQKQAEDYLKALTDELIQTKNEILAMASDIEHGKEQDVSAVSKLYSKAHAPKTKIEDFVFRP